MLALAHDPLAVWIASLLLAGIFARGAWHKLRDLGMARAIIEAYELIPQRFVAGLAPVLGGLEALVACGLLLPVSRAPAAMAAFALLTGYAVALGVNLQRGRFDIDCGCGGPGEGLSWLLVARNGALMLVALVAMGAATVRTLGVRDAGVLLLTLACLWLLLMAVEQAGANHAARQRLISVFHRGA